jgi:K+/H+ antiporter YhaU regulatory subunit KhtT
VGIERAGQNIVNPGPDEEVVAGDRVLIIGTQKQLETAEKLLAAQVE